MAFFKKVACFTDIHFGLKGNSRVHNDDCEEFVKWFISQAKAEGCETCIFLGDWHHHRSATNVSTMNYTVSNMERLGAAFEKVYVIMGNHDLYYRDKREINSMEYIRNIPNIHIVNEWLVEDDVAIIPWVVQDEWKKIEKMKQKYVFGHFELPYFKMNAMVEMPDVGGIQTDHFAGCGKVFSGHFTATCEMVRLYSANIRHFYHGVHLEVRQFEVSKHIFLFHFFDLLPFVLHNPRNDGDIILNQPFVHYVYVWNVPDVFH